MFTSGALEVNRHEFEDSRYMAKESHANELANLLGNQYGEDSPIGEMDSQIPESRQQQLPPIQNIIPEPTVELPPRKPPAGKYFYVNNIVINLKKICMLCVEIILFRLHYNYTLS